MSDRIHSLDDFLLLLKGVKPGKDGQITALCPGHYDQNRSLSIKEADGKLLVKCFAGCDTASILKSLSLDAKDLFLNGHKPTERREIEAVYDYGIFQVVRTKPKGFYQRRPDGNGGWIQDLKGITPCLYHQDDIRRAALDATTVYIVEGEKDADNVISIGGIATTNAGGAGKWADRYSDILTGGKVVIMPDKDEPGRKHGAIVAASLYGKVRSIKILELPGTGKDASDWIAAGGDLEQLGVLTESTPEWTPDSHYAEKLTCLATIEPEPVSWLWKPYIPLSKLSFLEGDPGTGKSQVGTAISTSVTLGTNGFPKGKVLLLSAEDGLADTIAPRLIQLGADRRCVFTPNELFTIDDAGLELLGGLIRYIRPLLVILDPIMAFLDTEVNINQANHVRHITANLARIAERYNCAILAIRHLTKGGSSKAIYRGSGSIDFTGAARSVLLAGLDSETGERALVHIKCNLAPLGKAIGYQLTAEGLQWTGDSEMTAQRIFADEGSSQAENAKAFLTQALAEGEVESNLVYEQADKLGISRATIKRAIKPAHVVSRHDGKSGKWYMSLDTHGGNDG